MTDKSILAASMQKRAGLSRILTAIPGIGGAAHGLIDPVEGSPRGTSLFYEGLGGLGGSALGGIAGSLAFKDEYGRPGPEGLLGGSSLGGVLGSHLGRWLAESKVDPEIEELRKMVAKLKGQGGEGVVINVGHLQQGGPTAAAAAMATEPVVESTTIAVETEEEDDGEG